MNRDEAKVRVRIDGSQAKKDLDDLTKHGAATAGRVGAGMRSSLGLGISALGGAVGGYVGGMIGSARSAIEGPTSSGISDIVGEYTSRWGAQLNEAVLGGLSPEARAAKRAREDVIAAHQAAGRDAHTSPAARAMFDQMKAIYFEQEKSRAAFEADANFGGVSQDEAVSQALQIANKANAIVGAIKEGFDRVIAEWKAHGFHM